LAGAALLICVGAARGTDVLGLKDKVLSADPQARSEAEQAIVDERARVVEELVGIVQDPAAREQHPDGVIAAIRLLGKIRAAEACDTLASVISFHEPQRKKLRIPRAMSTIPDMPAVEALIQIGSPALRSILSAAQAGKYDYLEYAGAADVMRGVLGKRLALVYVQDAIEAQTDSQQRGRLERLRHLVEKGIYG
jgi:hypothetical protein